LPLTPTQAFARSVKRARQLHGINQQQLAERLTEVGVPTTQSTVARVETGKRGVSLDDALAFSIALDVPLVRLLGGQAVDDEMISLAPKWVYEAELARLHMVGDFYSDPTAAVWGKDLYGWWKGRSETDSDNAPFERARREGRLRSTTSADGVTVHLIVGDRTEGGDDA
jgi:transcriptional regulator with XRE-family HTH domain